MFWRLVRALLLLNVVPLISLAQSEVVGVRPVTIETVAATARAMSLSRDPRVVAGKDSSLKKAYDDVFEILAAENACSDFYGLTAAATTVLNRLLGNIERGQLPVFICFHVLGARETLLTLGTGNVLPAL